MYFFNAVDRSNISNAKTDGIDRNLGFVGEEYSLLILLFYIPFGLLDLPLNILTKRFSARRVLPSLMTTWGVLSLLQCATTNFAGILVLRLLMGAMEAGFFAGVVWYFTIFYRRNELGFRISVFLGSAQLAAAFSGLVAFGVFQIKSSLYGWQYLFLIEGGLTVIFGVIAFFYLPATPATARFLGSHEKAAARARALRDASSQVDIKFNINDCFRTWKKPSFIVWLIICSTYAVAFATTSNFLPQFVELLGLGVVRTNLYTVAPNAVGFVCLLAIAWSSDHFRERTFHVTFSLVLSMVGMIILAAIDVERQIRVGYFATFLMAAGAYVPSCLVQSWQNNNNLNETSRAATTGLLVGLGNFMGILSAATFRAEYAPKYIPTLIATCCCNAVAITAILSLGLWMKRENRLRDQKMGVTLTNKEVNTEDLDEGEKSLSWRYFT
jgi:sugar phosphate permease